MSCAEGGTARSSESDRGLIAAEAMVRARGPVGLVLLGLEDIEREATEEGLGDEYDDKRGRKKVTTQRRGHKAVCRGERVMVVAIDGERELFEAEQG